MFCAHTICNNYSIYSYDCFVWDWIYMWVPNRTENEENKKVKEKANAD